jgi:hypothetical protein
MMPEAGSASPALSLAALGETLDLLGVVVARMSEKLDQHGETLAQTVQKTALESRDAAQAAKAYADPQRYGRHIGNEIDKALAVPSTGWKACTWPRCRSAGRRRTLDDLVRQEEANPSAPAGRSGKGGTLEEAHSIHSTLRVGPGARPDHRPAPLHGRQRYRLRCPWG